MNFKLEQPTLHIPEEIMHEAVKMFAHSSSRPTVVDYILSIDPRPEGLEWIDHLEENDAKIKIGQKIRSADPKSGKFSKTLYGDLYVMHREAARTRAAKVAMEIIGSFRQSFLSNDLILKGLVAELTDLTAIAENTEPQNNSEYLNTCKTLISVIEAQNKNAQLAQDAVLDLVGSDMFLTEAEVDIFRSEGGNDRLNAHDSPHFLSEECED